MSDIELGHLAPEGSEYLRQWPYQIRAGRKLPEMQRRLVDRFPELLPLKPYAADVLEQGLLILPRVQALRRRHIQLNGPSAYTWMTHDIDDPSAYYMVETTCAIAASYPAKAFGRGPVGLDPKSPLLCSSTQRRP